MRDGDIRSWASPMRSSEHQQPQQMPASSPVQEPPRRRIRIMDSDDDDHPPGGRAEEVQANPAPQMTPAVAAPQPQPQHVRLAADVVQLDTSESDDMYMLLPPSSPPGQDEQCGQGLRSPKLPPADCRRNPVRAIRRRRFEASAVESSEADDDSSECIEIDTDAQALYREAILGIRNARNARSQLRAATAPCPVCALFAHFLGHFL